MNRLFGLFFVFVLAGCGRAVSDVDGDLYRFQAGDPVAVSSDGDDVAFTIVVAFDYLAAEFLPDIPPANIDCMLSDGLSVFSMERSAVHERKVGGEKVTPIVTIRARGQSGVLECQDVFAPGRGSLHSLRAVVSSGRVD